MSREDDADDPLMVAEYVDDIFDYLTDLQTQTMPNPEYMLQQPNLEWKMRGILVDWLVEVHSKYRLLPETLFLAVNIIDRFLSAKHVPLEKLQLCGITAMFIASKYEEVLAPHISHFRDLADDSITEQEILTAERHMLATLKYDLSYPNPMNFLRRISKADSYDISTRTFGKYLLEMTILDYKFMDCPPSLAAAAAMYLSRHILQKSDWVCCVSHPGSPNPIPDPIAIPGAIVLTGRCLRRITSSHTTPATPKKRSSPSSTR